MKKLIKITSCIMLLFIFVFTLVSCNDKKDKDEVILNYLNEYTEQKAVYSNCDIVLEKPTYSYYGDVVLTMECEGEVTTLYDSSQHGYYVDFEEDIELSSLDSKEYTLTFTIGDTFKTYNRRGTICGLVNKDLNVDLEMHGAYILMNENIENIDFLKTRKEYQKDKDRFVKKTTYTTLVYLSIDDFGKYNLYNIEFKKNSQYFEMKSIKLYETITDVVEPNEVKKYCFCPNYTQEYSFELSDGVECNIYDYENNKLDNYFFIKNHSYYLDLINNSSNAIDYTFTIKYKTFEDGAKAYKSNDFTFYMFTPKESGIYYFEYSNEIVDYINVYYGNDLINIDHPVYYSSDEEYIIVICKLINEDTTINYTLVNANSSESKYNKYEITSSNYYEVSGGDYYVLHDNLIREKEDNDYFFAGDVIYSENELTLTEAEYKYTIKVNDLYIVENRGTLTELNVGDTIYKIELYKKLSSEDGLGEIVDSYWRVDNKEETSYLIGETKMIIVYDALNPRESIDFTIKPKPLDI